MPSPLEDLLESISVTCRWMRAAVCAPAASCVTVGTTVCAAAAPANAQHSKAIVIPIAPKE
jgi:hypothetical protein